MPRSRLPPGLGSTRRLAESPAGSQGALTMSTMPPACNVTRSDGLVGMACARPLRQRQRRCRAQRGAAGSFSLGVPPAVATSAVQPLGIGRFGLRGGLAAFCAWPTRSILSRTSRAARVHAPHPRYYLAFGYDNPSWAHYSMAFPPLNRLSDSTLALDLDAAPYHPDK